MVILYKQITVVRPQEIQISEIKQEFLIIESEKVELIEKYNTMIHLINLTDYKGLIEQLKAQYKIMPEKHYKQLSEIIKLEKKLIS